MQYREIIAVCSVTHNVDIRMFNLMVNIVTIDLHHVAL